MDTNYKNTLQVYFQAYRLPLPDYNTIIIGGSDHEPKWQSIISFHFNDTKISLVGGIFPRKIYAEMDAARMALHMIYEKCEKTSACTDVVMEKQIEDKSITTSVHADVTKLFYTDPEFYVKSSRIVMIVDLENMPKWLDLITTECPNITGKMDIFAVIGEYHILAHKELPAGVTKIFSPSTRTDGSDACIQMMVGAWLSQNKYDIYLVVSYDKFAHNVIDLVKHDGLFWKAQDGRVVTRMEHLKPYILK